jgi:DNA (cytosine-5)-methyltransferase 1
MLVAALGQPPLINDALSLAAVPVRPVSWALADLVDCTSDAVFDTAAVHSPENERRIRYLFEHDLYDLPDQERPPCHRTKAHSYRSVYGRMRWDEPAPTITTGFGSTGQGRFVHPLRPRSLTPHEAARLQTLPDFFQFGDPGRTQLQKMIGNSVPPLAMAAVAAQLFH